MDIYIFSEIMSFTIPNLDAFYLKAHADELLRLYYEDPVSEDTVRMLESLCGKLRTGGQKLEEFYKDCFDDLFDLLTRYCLNILIQINAHNYHLSGFVLTADWIYS